MGRILIAEDDRTVQKALLRLFEHDGFSVEVASDGKSAIEAFHAAIPAAVVLGQLYNEAFQSARTVGSRARSNPKCDGIKASRWNDIRWRLRRL